MIDALLFAGVIVLAVLLARELIAWPGCSGDCAQGDRKCNCNKESK